MQITARLSLLDEASEVTKKKKIFHFLTGRRIKEHAYLGEIVKK